MSTKSVTEIANQLVNLASSTGLEKILTGQAWDQGSDDEQERYSQLQSEIFVVNAYRLCKEGLEDLGISIVSDPALVNGTATDTESHLAAKNTAFNKVIYDAYAAAAQERTVSEDQLAAAETKLELAKAALINRTKETLLTAEEVLARFVELQARRDKLVAQYAQALEGRTQGFSDHDRSMARSAKFFLAEFQKSSEEVRGDFSGSADLLEEMIAKQCKTNPTMAQNIAFMQALGINPVEAMLEMAGSLVEVDRLSSQCAYANLAADELSVAEKLLNKMTIWFVEELEIDTEQAQELLDDQNTD